MFDIIDFAGGTGLTVTVVGMKNPNIAGIAVSDNYGYMAGDIFMVKQPDETDAQYAERLQKFIEQRAAELGSKKALHIKNAYDSRKRAVIEDMFRGK